MTEESSKIEDMEKRCKVLEMQNKRLQERIRKHDEAKAKVTSNKGCLAIQRTVASADDVGSEMCPKSSAICPTCTAEKKDMSVQHWEEQKRLQRKIESLRFRPVVASSCSNAPVHSLIADYAIIRIVDSLDLCVVFPKSLTWNINVYIDARTYALIHVPAFSPTDPVKFCDKCQNPYK